MIKEPRHSYLTEGPGYISATFIYLTKRPISTKKLNVNTMYATQTTNKHEV